MSQKSNSLPLRWKKIRPLLPMNRDLTGIIEKAFSGDAVAQAHLVDYAAVAALALEDLARMPGNSLKSVARDLSRFPVLMGRHPDDLENSRSLIALLEVGSNSPIALPTAGKKGWSKSTHANKLVLNYWQVIKGARWRPLLRDVGPRFSKKLESEFSKLPPLSAFSRSTWFEAIWRAVLEDEDGHPERNPELHALGAYRREHNVGTSAPATIAANVRDGIKTRLRAAFDRIFPA